MTDAALAFAAGIALGVSLAGWSALFAYRLALTQNATERKALLEMAVPGVDLGPQLDYSRVRAFSDDEDEWAIELSRKLGRPLTRAELEAEDPHSWQGI